MKLETRHGPIFGLLTQPGTGRVFVAVDTGAGYQRYAVWELDPGTGECYSGDYYPLAEQATAGLIERAGWNNPAAILGRAG
jgi:hypothetical protein